MVFKMIVNLFKGKHMKKATPKKSVVKSKVKATKLVSKKVVKSAPKKKK